MPNKHFISFIVFLVAWGISSGSEAQIKQDVFSRIKKIGEMFEEKGTIQEGLKEVNQSKIDQFAKVNGLGFDDAKMLYSLRDPFEPQLPQVVEARPEEDDSVQRDVVPVYRDPGEEGRLLSEMERPVVNFNPDAFRIKGLIWNTDRPQAIINDKVYDVGDEINEFKIEKIDRSGVKVSCEGQMFTIEPKGVSDG